MCNGEQRLLHCAALEPLLDAGRVADKGCDLEVVKKGAVGG